MQLDISRLSTLRQSVKLDGSVSRGGTDQKASAESFRLGVRVVGDLPDFFLMGLEALHNRVGIQLPEEKLALFGAKDHVFIAGKDCHTKYILLIETLFCLDLKVVALSVHEEVNRPDFNCVEGVGGKELIVGCDDDSPDSLLVTVHLAVGLLKSELLLLFLFLF